jgi:hypothetical protein
MEEDTTILKVVPVGQVAVVEQRGPLMEQFMVVKPFPVKAMLEGMALILA